MKTLLPAWASVVCVLGLPPHAIAAIYCVAPSAGATGCALEEPCSVDTAVRKLAPGDTLLLRGGTYPQAVYIEPSGTVSAPITASSYPGELAVISGNDTIPASVWGVLLHADCQQHHPPRRRCACLHDRDRLRSHLFSQHVVERTVQVRSRG